MKWLKAPFHLPRVFAYTFFVRNLLQSIPEHVNCSTKCCSRVLAVFKTSKSLVLILGIFQTIIKRWRCVFILQNWEFLNFTDFQMCRFHPGATLANDIDGNIVRSPFYLSTKIILWQTKLVHYFHVLACKRLRMVLCEAKEQSDY